MGIGFLKFFNSNKPPVETEVEVVEVRELTMIEVNVVHVSSYINMLNDFYAKVVFNVNGSKYISSDKNYTIDIELFSIVSMSGILNKHRDNLFNNPEHVKVIIIEEVDKKVKRMIEDEKRSNKVEEFRCAVNQIKPFSFTIPINGNTDE